MTEITCLLEREMKGSNPFTEERNIDLSHLLKNEMKGSPHSLEREMKGFYPFIDSGN